MLLLLGKTSFLSFAIVFNFFVFLFRRRSNTSAVSDAQFFFFRAQNKWDSSEEINIVVYNDGKWAELMSNFDSRNEFDVKMHLLLESNPLSRKNYSHQQLVFYTRISCSVKESWIIIHCCDREREKKKSLHECKKKLLWILIHRLFSWALWIKIHVCRLCLTNIYTFLGYPFYSQSAHHQHAAFFHNREWVSTIVPKYHSLNQYRIIFHLPISLFLFFFSPALICLSSHIPHCNANHFFFSKCVHCQRDLWMNPFLKVVQQQNTWCVCVLNNETICSRVN